MLSVSGSYDSRKLIGSRWIPAFAGMTISHITRFKGMTTYPSKYGCVGPVGLRGSGLTTKL